MACKWEEHLHDIGSGLYATVSAFCGADSCIYRSAALKGHAECSQSIKCYGLKPILHNTYILYITMYNHTYICVCMYICIYKCGGSI
jgi:hypothetical protein